jgi:hypothetical protein
MKEKLQNVLVRAGMEFIFRLHCTSFHIEMINDRFSCEGIFARHYAQELFILLNCHHFARDNPQNICG